MSFVEVEHRKALKASDNILTALEGPNRIKIVVNSLSRKTDLLILRDCGFHMVFKITRICEKAEVGIIIT